MTMNEAVPPVITFLNGATIFTSASMAFNELRSAVMNVMTRKILNNSLAATKLAEKMPMSPLIGLPVMANTTRNVPMTDGTTTLARLIMVKMITITLIKYSQ